MHGYDPCWALLRAESARHSMMQDPREAPLKDPREAPLEASLEAPLDAPLEAPAKVPGLSPLVPDARLDSSAQPADRDQPVRRADQDHPVHGVAQKPDREQTPAALHSPRLVVGLTGGIGSGKSTVAQSLVERGAALVDTDLIAHQLTAAGGEAIAPIREAFGPSFLTSEGALDRASMRALVFQDPQQRRRLEAILHPLIRAASDAQIAAAHAAGAPYVLLAIPLLVESGAARARVARVLVVDCPEEVQIRRVMQRSELSRTQVLAIMQAQASRAQRRELADDVVDNTGSIADLEAQIDALHRRYMQLASARRESLRAEA